MSFKRSTTTRKKLFKIGCNKRINHHHHFDKTRPINSCDYKDSDNYGKYCANGVDDSYLACPDFDNTAWVDGISLWDIMLEYPELFSNIAGTMYGDKMERNNKIVKL